MQLVSVATRTDEALSGPCLTGLLAPQSTELQKSSIGILLAFGVGHIIAIWGHVAQFWLDEAVTLHEIERFSRGDLPYSGFYWPYPPLAVWLFGSIAAVFGSHLTSIWFTSSVVYLLLLLLYGTYVSSVFQRPYQVPVLITALSLLAAYGRYVPLGDFTAVRPLGFLCLLIALVCSLRLFRAPRARYAVGLGLGIGLTFLSKQDFWTPALYLGGTACALLLTMHRGRYRSLAFVVAGSAFAVVLPSTAVIASQSSWSQLPHFFLGTGQAAAIFGPGLPSWELVVTELFVSALIAFLTTSSVGIARVIPVRILRPWLLGFGIIALLAAIVHLTASYTIGQALRADGPPITTSRTALYLATSVGNDFALAKASVRWLVKESLNHYFPFILTSLTTLFLLFRWRTFASVDNRTLILFLLGLCIAARARRQFQGVEWFHTLLELPVYILIIQLFLHNSQEHAKRTAIVMTLGFIAIGSIFAYKEFAYPLGVTAGVVQEVDTPKGQVVMKVADANDYAIIQQTFDALDPKRERPVLGEGYSGSFNYFLDRHNPTQLTEGIVFSTLSKEDVVEQIRRYSPPFFLIDNSALRTAKSAAPYVSPYQWENDLILLEFRRIDAIFFDEIMRDCLAIRSVGIFTLYNCDRQ